MFSNNMNGALLSPKDNRDYIFELISGKSDGSLNTPFLIDESYKFIARNQKSEGSCVAFAMAHIKEVQENIDVKSENYFSPRFIYSNRPNQSVEGMFPREALNILYTKGIVSEEEFPYETKTTDKDLSSIAIENRIKGYARVFTINGIKKALLKRNPVYVTIMVKSYGNEFWLGDSNHGLHGLCIVGWSNTGFILRNSWGTGFGFDGYEILPFSEFKSIKESWTLVDDETLVWKKNKDKPWFKFLRFYFTNRVLINILLVTIGLAALITLILCII